ncbi:MAG: hypothetical protein GY835_24970 [bacterium]|nr:hypothetical protein [bacterium]
MRPILGGNVPPERVVGRDAFIKGLWQSLENQSAVLVSERRIGKTSVLRKMANEPRDGWYPVYMVIEGVRSPAEFISRIVDAVSPILSRRKRNLARLQRFFDEIGGQPVGTWNLPELKDGWKKLLVSTLEDVRDNFDERVVFLWDELPLMVSNIKDDHEAKVAMELLDCLRDQRVADDSGKLRMVFTGSIGLHLVISELLHKGYRNDPTNDMETFSLEGLAPEHAQELALQGMQALVDDGDIKLAAPAEALAKEIAEGTDGLPFYINYTVDRLTEIGEPVEVPHVAQAIDSLILDPEDKAHFDHYAERIEAYYLYDERSDDLALLILKILSHAGQPMAEGQIWDDAVAQIELTSEVLFQKTLNLLVKDHYLVRTVRGSARSYAFKYRIVQRWWLKNRG